MKANHLEAELAFASKSHRGIGTAKKKPPKRKHEPPDTKEVQGSSRVANKACLQGYTFGFKVSELIMRYRFLEVGGVTEPLVLSNAMLEEIVNAIRHWRERLIRALGLINIVLPYLFPRNE